MYNLYKMFSWYIMAYVYTCCITKLNNFKTWEASAIVRPLLTEVRHSTLKDRFLDLRVYALASARARARVSCLYGSWRELQWGCLSSALPALINGYDDNPVLKTAPEKQRQWALTMAEEDDARIRILQSLRGKICKFTLRDQCCPSIAVGRRVREVGTGTSERRLLMIRQP